MARRYTSRSGDPRGLPEHTGLCIAVVVTRDRGRATRQCGRKRTQGPGNEYCGHHARMLAAGEPVEVPEDMTGLRQSRVGT